MIHIKCNKQNVNKEEDVKFLNSSDVPFKLKLIWANPQNIFTFDISIIKKSRSIVI